MRSSGTFINRFHRQLVIATRLHHNLEHVAKANTFLATNVNLQKNNWLLTSRTFSDDASSKNENDSQNLIEGSKSEPDQNYLKNLPLDLQLEDDIDDGKLAYDSIQTVEEVKERLIKESEVITFHKSGLYKYPCGENYNLKVEVVESLERNTVKPYKDFHANNLIESTVLVIGGGLLGTSIAYWIRELGTDAYDVNVIDRDFKYLHSNTGLSAACLQQQFSSKECIELAHYSADFIRSSRRYLSILDKEPPDVDFCPTSNLILATEQEIDQVLRIVEVQNKLGQKTIAIDRDDLKIRFPWLNCGDDIVLASLSLENEGHFNSKALLKAMRSKAENLQARFYECEFVDFNQHLIRVVSHDKNILQVERIRDCILRNRTNDLMQVRFDHVVIAAGADNYKFGPLLGFYDETHPHFSMRFPLPLKKRKRYYYAFECDEGPAIDFPLLMDSSGVFCRSHNFAGRYITGKMPTEDEEIDNNNSDVDYRYFENIIKPVLVKRVPAFRNLTLLRGWSCFEDVNAHDGLPLIGRHPFLENVTVVGGLGVHAASLAPAIGRAVAEDLLFGEYQTVDITRFGWERFFTNYQMEEKMKF